MIQGIHSGSLGAYQVSYWVLTQVGFTDLAGLRQLIQTGRIEGEPLIPKCPIRN